MNRENQYWTYVNPKTIDKDQPEFIKISEAEILKEFFPYWSNKMKKYGREELISEDNCISDWAILKWAHKNEDSE